MNIYRLISAVQRRFFLSAIALHSLPDSLGRPEEEEEHARDVRAVHAVRLEAHADRLAPLGRLGIRGYVSGSERFRFRLGERDRISSRTARFTPFFLHAQPAVPLSPSPERGEKGTCSCTILRAPNSDQ